MTKYISPSYELEQIQSKDIITISIEENGESSYNYNGDTVYGNKYTITGQFSSIF